MNQKVTVLIANHNYGNYIQDAIKSCLEQTYQPLQICVVDDGSNDGSWNIIHNQLFMGHEYKTGKINGIFDIKMLIKNNCKYTAIKLPEALGPSAARNIGIEVTKEDTDIYAILDADDYMKKNKIERCLAKFEQNELGVVYADYDILNVATKNVIREYKEPFSRNKLLQECIVHSGSLIRKQALLDTLEQTGYYDSTLRVAEDYDLWLRISEKYMISHIPESLTIVRVHNNNSTNSVKNEVWQRAWQRVSAKTKARNGYK